MTAAAQAIDILEEAVDRSRADPAWFLENILCCIDQCDDWQIEVLQAIADVWRLSNGLATVVNHEGRNRITIVSCHGPGKTHELALILHWWNFCFYGLVVGTAPKQDQIKTRFMPRYRKIRKGALMAYQQLQGVDTTKISILKDPDWGYVGETASEPENLAGYHDTPQLFLVDEASSQRLDPMFPVIEGALTTPGSVLVQIGNPTRSRGEFHSAHNKPGTMELYYKVHVDPTKSRYVDQSWVDNMKRKYGVDSPIFKIRCLGLFVEAERNQLIHMSWLAEAAERIYQNEGDGSVPRRVMSIDVSDGGDDLSVITITIFHDSITLFRKQKKYSFPATIAPAMLAKEAEILWEQFEFSDKEGDSIVVDAMGVGAGCAGNLILAGYPVVTFKGGAASDDPLEWRNQRVQCGLAMRNDYRDGKVIIHPDAFDDEEDRDTYFDQCVAVRTNPGTERVEDLETKEQHIKRTMKSPDHFDSAMMAYTSQQPYIASGEAMVIEGNDMVAAHADW